MNATKYSDKVKVTQEANHGPLRITFQELSIFPSNTNNTENIPKTFIKNMSVRQIAKVILNITMASVLDVENSKS